jgi:hypothetical protein
MSSIDTAAPGPATSGTGASLSGTGASLTGTGASLSGTGASLSDTGASLSDTGASLSDTGASLSDTGRSSSDPGNERDGVRVDLAELRRTAAGFTDLAMPLAEVQALATTRNVVAASASMTTSAGAAGDAVDATRAGLRDLATTTVALADGLAEAARRYADSDHRAAGRATAGAQRTGTWGPGG